MSGKRIKGITIEIGSDTVGLQKALSDVNKKSSKLQSELKDVERLLKFNPGNVEALAQKQKLLNEQVATTSDKLKQLKEAEKQVQDQFKQGKISEEQYRSFRREIEFTEGSLKKMKNEVSLVEIEQQKLSSSSKQLETLLKTTDLRAENLSSTLGDKLTRALTSGTAGAKQIETAIEKIGKEALGAEVDLEKLKNALSAVDDGASIDKVKKDLTQLSKEAKSAEDSVEGLGIEMENVAGALVAGGGLAGAIEAAFDVSSLDTNIDITLDVPESSKAAVKDAIRTVESYGVDAEAALEGVRRQWVLNKDASDETNAAVVRGAGAIAKAYTQIDFSELIQESNEIASSLKISNEESIGLVNALLKVGFPPEQLDIISEYGTQLQMAGYTAEEIQALFAAGIETGTWNIDNLLDGLKEGRIRVAEFGEEVPKAMKELLDGTSISAEQFQEWGTAVSKGGETGSKAMREIAEALTGIEDETKKNLIGVQVFGTIYEDQGQNIIDTILNAKDATVDLRANQELLNETTSKLDEDPLVRLQEAGKELKAALAPILSVIADIVAKMADWAAENPKFTATIVAIVTAIGILVGAIAALAPGFVALSGAISGAGGAAAVFGSALAVLTGPVGLTIAALAALGIGAVALANEMKKPALEAEIFSDKVSESTQKAVGSYMELDERANASLNNLAWGQRTVTQEMANGIVATFDEMGNQILTEMQTDHEEQLATMKDFFLRSDVMNAEEEAKAIEKLRASQEEKRLSIEEGQKRIQEILSNAVEERRALTENERAIIATIQEQMKSDAITVMTENQAEQQAIYEQMKVNASEITAQQAAEVVKQSVKQKNDVVKEANDQYNQSVAAIIKMRDESGSISKEQADNMIREATKQKDEVVARAEEMHSKVVSEAQAQATEHIAAVDWETGEIMSRWDQIKKFSDIAWGYVGNKVEGVMKDIGKFILTGMVDAGRNFRGGLDDLKEDAATKLYELLSKFNDFKNDLVSFFANLVLKIPTPSMPKLPEFDLEWASKSFMGKTISYPTGFDVTWHKTGGVFKNPVVLGNAGFGDVEEAIVPFEGPHAARIAGLIAGEMNKILGGNHGGFKQELHFHGDKMPSPSETARKNLQASRQLAMEWGF
jgi:phage-related minor tail protein